jgi:NAD(P)-dependent dehydrogenase (short-subunit alcohol dehydrogenase family)
VTVVLVTGATSGLGRGVATALVERGITVLVHGRDQAKIDAAVAELGGPDVARAYRADLGSLAEVRALADELLEAEERIDVLVNNAGVALGERQESADGIELTFAVNYLAGFVLSNRLLPGVDRIVNVASIGQAPIDWDDPLLENDWEFYRAYAQSKLAQITFTMALAEREPGVKVNALHPATLMDTQMVANTFGRTMSTVEDGVRPTVALILRDDVTGQYFDQDRPERAHEQAYDAQAQARLWELSEKLSA